MKKHDAPLDRIRVPSVLAHYPVHHLSRHASGPIAVREVSGSGELTITWQVEHDGGPLAYQIDTLIVNRRIDEAPRPIPPLIRLGTLREIARELGVSDDNTERIREALYHNAKAFIRAKIKFRCHDGTERWIEFGDTRYGIILTGEKLPDGRTADGVYLKLHDTYRTILDDAQRRPLDYDYLRHLGPAAQRLYELLSVFMYAALKQGQPRARMSYAEFCMFAPQTRYTTLGEVRKQMEKLHSVHRDAGYIGQIEFEATRDREGRPDWIMLYTPGPRAKAEFRTFTTRLDAPAQATSALKPTASALPPVAPAPELEPLSLEPLAAELVARGMTATTAAELVRKYPEERIKAQIAGFDWHRKKSPQRISEPGAFLYNAIRDNYAPPVGLAAEAARRARAEAERAQAAADRAKKARERAEQDQVEAYWASLSPAEQAALEAEALEQAAPEVREQCGSTRPNFAKAMRRKAAEELIRRRLGLPVPS